MSFVPITLLLATLGQADAQAPLSAADDAKVRQRIDLLEREAARLTRELDELRGKLGVRKTSVKSEELLRSLESSFESLRKETLDQELLAQAVRCFDRGDAKQGLRCLRIGRSRAAVPLILSVLVKLESHTKLQPKDAADHLVALALLTGEDVEGVFARTRSAHGLIQEWWLPRQMKIVTDIGKMMPEQVAHVARRLREVAGPVDAYTSNGPSYYANALMYRLFANRWDTEEETPSGRPVRNWYAEELHPALGPALLAGMGHRTEGAGGQDVAIVPYQLVHLMATMRRNSMFPQLHKIAEDETQNSAVRLVCLGALKAAGEGVRVPAVLTVLAREKKLDRRLACLEFLYYADDLEPAADYLLEAIDDPNEEVRRSALNAIRKNPPTRLLKRLQQMIQSKHDSQVLETIAAVKTPEVQQFLADYLAKTMDDRPKK
jgi:hypothetical protein